MPAVHDPRIPALRPVAPLERLGAAMECLLCSGLPSQLLLMLVLNGLGMRMHLADGRLSPSFVFTLSLVDAAVVISLVVLVLRAHHESVRTVLFGERHYLREAFIGVALLPAVFMAVALVLVAILKWAPRLHNVPRNPLEDMLTTRGDALIFAAVVMIAGGVREEVQRGFILHRFGRYLGGAGWGVVIYSVLFGMGHFEQGYDAMIATGILGVLWGLLFLARRSIVAPMVSHAGFNLAQLLKFLVIVR